MLSLCLSFIAIAAFSQSKADYEHTMNKFMKFYNHNQADSIRNMFSDSYAKLKDRLMPMDLLLELKKKYGKMESYKYIGVTPEDTVTIFKTVFTKHKQATGILLNKENKMETFRFETTSEEIDSLLKAVKH